jgi:EmrB/QacA subfamily drug resistance transporter
MHNNKTIALVATSLAIFFLAFGNSAINVALPVIGRQFAVDTILLNWMALAFGLAIAVLSIPVGKIADIVGIKKIFVLGMILYTLSSFAAIFTFSSLMLIVIRLAQGIGCAMALGTSLSMISAIIPAKERGQAIGINTGCLYIGASLGPFLGGVLIEHLGWPAIFYVNVPVGIGVVWLTLWKVHGEWRTCQGEKFDYFGSVVYGIALIALMYGFSLLPGITGAVLVAGGIIAGLIFLWWENRIPSPVLNVSVIRHNRPFILSNVTALLSYSASFIVGFLLSLYLQYVKGFSPQMAGFILVSQPVVQAVISPISGKLSDKIEPRLVSSLGMGLTCLSLLSFAFLTVDTPIILVIVPLLVLGVGFSLFSSPNANAIMGSVVPQYYGVAAAMLNTMRSVGQLLGNGITMIIMAVIIGRVQITPVYYPAFLISVRVAFGIFALFCFAGIFTSLASKKNKSSAPNP